MFLIYGKRTPLFSIADVGYHVNSFVKKTFCNIKEKKIMKNIYQVPDHKNKQNVLKIRHFLLNIIIDSTIYKCIHVTF